MRLDLGSGAHPRDGYDGVDVVDLGQAWIVDLDATPWPWDDSTVKEVHSAHFVEHVADLPAFMDELWRVMAPGALAEIRHPYAWSDEAVADPTHRRQLVEMSWYYYDRDWRAARGLAHYAISCDFPIQSFEMHLTPDWAQRRAEGLASGAWDDSKLRNGVNIIKELTVILECRK